jgi:hypothetical protein
MTPLLLLSKAQPDDMAQLMAFDGVLDAGAIDSYGYTGCELPRGGSSPKRFVSTR